MINNPSTESIPILSQEERKWLEELILPTDETLDCLSICEIVNGLEQMFGLSLIEEINSYFHIQHERKDFQECYLDCTNEFLAEGCDELCCISLSFIDLIDSSCSGCFVCIYIRYEGLAAKLEFEEFHDV